MASHFDLPIFISSTEYNLADLRGELLEFLNRLGYRAILSSDEGFHDRSPELCPWESCLPVIDECLVVIVVIDGRYGTALPWPNYEEVFNKQRLSPTHGEFLYARAKRKRLMVFVRKSLLADYERYREAKKAIRGQSRLKKQLFLPKYVNFETLKFIEDVKTSDPICWFRSFTDVTDIKREVQHQLLNELASAFRRVQTHVVQTLQLLAMGIDSLPAEQKAKLLETIGVPDNMIDDLRTRASEIDGLRSEIKKVQVGRKTPRGAREHQLAEMQARVDSLAAENVQRLVSTVLDVSHVSSNWSAHERTRRLLEAIGLDNPFVLPRSDLPAGGIE